MVTTQTRFEHIDQVLNNLAEKIVHPDEKLMRRLGDVVVEDIDKRFNTRGYGTWPALSPRTVKRKGNDFVLWDSGTMMNSVVISALGVGTVTVSVPTGGRNNSSDVPGFHQNGTRHIPQRKIVADTPQLRLALRHEVINWVKDMVKAAGKTV